MDKELLENGSPTEDSKEYLERVNYCEEVLPDLPLLMDILASKIRKYCKEADVTLVDLSVEANPFPVYPGEPIKNVIVLGTIVYDPPLKITEKPFRMFTFLNKEFKDDDFEELAQIYVLNLRAYAVRYKIWVARQKREEQNESRDSVK